MSLMILPVCKRSVHPEGLRLWLLSSLCCRMSSWMWFTGCGRSLQSSWVWSGEWHRWRASWESPCKCPAHSRRCHVSPNKSDLFSSSPRQILHHQRRRAVRVLQQLPADRWGRLRWHVGTHQGRLHDLFCSVPGGCCHLLVLYVLTLQSGVGVHGPAQLCQWPQDFHCNSISVYPIMPQKHVFDRLARWSAHSAHHRRVRGDRCHSRELCAASHCTVVTAALLPAAEVEF